MVITLSPHRGVYCNHRMVPWRARILNPTYGMLGLVFPPNPIHHLSKTFPPNPNLLSYVLSILCVLCHFKGRSTTPWSLRVSCGEPEEDMRDHYPEFFAPGDLEVGI